MTTYRLGLESGGHLAYRFLRGLLRGQVRQFQADVADPRAAQKRRMHALLSANSGTSFGEEHAFAAIKTFDDFRQAIPIRTHAELLPWLDRATLAEPNVLTAEPISMLLETSGTTGRPKHLPVTSTWEESVQRAQRLWSLGLAREQPSMASGKFFSLVSPRTHAVSPGGIPIGSNTGRIRAAQPYWLRRRYAVPDSVMQVDSSVVRQYLALRFGIGEDVRAITTANPSLLLLLFRRLDQWRDALSQDIRDGTCRCGPAALLESTVRADLERRVQPRSVPSDWSPTGLWNLASVNCWKGGPATFFADRLASLLAPVPVRELGVNASEGTFAVPLSQAWPGSVLWVGGHLLEFVDADEQVRWAWELEEGETYRIVVSTSAGLWRYDMCDLVEVVGFVDETPMIRFVGKAGRYLNAVGERVTAAQISETMQAIEGDMRGFTVSVEMGEVPSYLIVFEGEMSTEDVVRTLDSGLSLRNVEYASKRGSERLGPPKGRSLPSGHYARYRESQIKKGAPDGQLKDPVVAVNEEEWSRLLMGEDTA